MEIDNNVTLANSVEYNTNAVRDEWENTISSVINRLSGTPQNDYANYAEVEDDEDYEIVTEQPLPSNNTTDIIQTTSRFSSAIWFEKIQQQEILLAGVGGIGSYVAFLLSRMKPRKITIYDPDTVESVNMAGQLFGARDIGLTKCRAVVDMMRNYSGYYYAYTYDRRFGAETSASKIMICGFDNMAARKIFFQKWLEFVDNQPREKRGECLFIDGRLNAEEFQVLCITGDNPYAISKYENDWLFDDSEVEEAVCSYKQTSYMANMIGSVMTNLFVNFCANMCDPIMPRDIPFLTRYDGTTMLFKTE